MVTMKQLRYFVEIVECRSFSQAAERLHVAQSALSRQIKELEALVQAELLQRLPRHVEVTPAGKTFYDGAKRMLFLMNDTLVKSRHVERDEAGLIRIVHSSSIPLTGALLENLQAVLAAHTQVSLDITQGPSEHHAAEIAEGRCDLGFARLPVQALHPQVVLEPLYEEALELAVAANHPLAQHEAVSVTSLREERFVSLPHGERGGLGFRVANLCMQHGFFPAAARAVSRKTTLLNLVEAGFGVALVPRSMRAIAPHSVRFIPLTGQDHGTTVALLYRKGSSALVDSFAALLKRQYGDRDSGAHGSISAGASPISATKASGAIGRPNR